MIRHRRLNILYIGCLLAAAAIVLPDPAKGFPTPSPAGPEKDPRLAPLLKAAGDYCEKVKRAALYYVCQENISDKDYVLIYRRNAPGMRRDQRIFDVRRTIATSYLYDYQLIKRDDRLTESRTLILENGQRRNKQNAVLEGIEHYGQFLVYGPVGFLSRYWQDHFRYTVVGEERVAGTRCLVVRAVPAEEREVNYQIGRLWIGPNAQILRLEVEPASLKEYKEEIYGSPIGEFRKKMVWTIDYGVEKNGVRFPSRQLIRKYLVRETKIQLQQTSLKRETVFEYSGYKFFQVETEVTF